MAFASVCSALSAQCLQVVHRQEGVTFLKTARSLYGVERIGYVGINIPTNVRGGVYSHCAYSDREALNCLSHQPLDPVAINRNWNAAPLDGEAGLGTVTSVPLRAHAGEIVGLQIFLKQFEQPPPSLIPELRILGSYFHSHVLRMNGQDVNKSMLISAKELDCLKWTASGKTAWEASVILGISERTVRFHLNAAREKLNCTTTTQAVAKAVANHLIDL